MEKCGPNVMAWQVVTGEKRWYFVGAYIAPTDEGTMEVVVQAIRRRPKGAELVVAGDLNANILAPVGRRAEGIATDLATEGLEDMAQHFMPRQSGWCRDWRTWEMRRRGQVVRYRTATFRNRRLSVPVM